ncbi:MAG: lytic transglycosylase domain-containing protein, partial [Silicimonas sp.]|nr:lytic transglycosylase domain-containing protein [Silicimonas sp.]
AGPVARDIIEWHRLRSGGGDFDSVQRFLKRRSDWPGLQLMRRKGEAHLPLGSRADEVIAFFDGEPPQTGGGALSLITAYRAKGLAADAETEAVRAWLTMILSTADEDALMRDYGNILKPYHEARLDMLLWRGADQNIGRMVPRVSKGWKALASARMGLRGAVKGIDTLVAAVPNNLSDHPGLLFERMQWRARKGRNEDAIELILAANPERLGEPSRWAGWRRGLARAEMRAGRTDIAYRLAANHGLSEGSHFADLEWLAGYIALTYRKDGDAALRHFLRFRGAVETPISLGRAGYWEGRAHRLLGEEEAARLAFSFGAEYQTSFYGLLAAEAADLPMDPGLTGREAYPDWQTTSLPASSVFTAVRLFIASGQRNLAEQFVRHMTETLPRDEIGALGDFLIAVDEPHLAVMVGKQAAQRGIVVASAYYPVVDLRVPDMPVPRELALAIARRESEFDPVVMSGVGARGLMQLMPGTAKEVARYLELPYSRDRLVSDPAYNARLGTAYLDELMRTFDGNTVMVSAGYNAGPGRPLRWMRDRGDPRQGDIDIVDWIEHIPFDETRNYVMRVAESLPVYRARLTGEVTRIAFTDELTAMPGHKRQALKGELKRPRARPQPLTD